MGYADFLEQKVHLGGDHGFDPPDVPDFLFPFQRDLVTWALRKGRAAIFADCGMGKTPMLLAWADAVARHTDGRVLVISPLAVTHQTEREGTKFGIECSRSSDGSHAGRITLTNYERVHLFNPEDYAGVVCDESSAIKSFDGKRRAEVTQFLRKRPYRLMCTATAAPNDYVELGTTSEALGEMGHVDMLSRFFRNIQGTIDTKAKWRSHSGMVPLWRFKRHAEDPFWRWVCSWARALRRPSDLGYEDGDFKLPELIETESEVETEKRLPGELFPRAAVSLAEQRTERRMTLEERCERAASVVNGANPAVLWCHLNAEADELVRRIPDAEQVSGADSDEDKVAKFLAFSGGDLRVLVTKPKIGGFGLNWQHCSNVVYFPSHSFEQYYQAVRRCWRFGQTKPVTVRIVTSEGESGVLKNLRRKAAAADTMFSRLVQHMNDSLSVKRENTHTQPMEVPTWL